MAINTKITDTWETFYMLGLVDKNANINTEVFEAAAQQNEEALTKLLHQCEDTEYIRNLSLDDLMKLPFDGARKVIEFFSMEKRINMLNDLSERRSFYYEQTTRYEGVPASESISASEFRSLLGKIKHLEIIQNWLYGII